MDFVTICTKEAKGGVLEVRPDFTVGRSKDLMVRGGAFYAIWDEERGLWSTDEYDVQRLVDQEIDKHVEKLKADGFQCSAKYLRSFGTNGWSQFRKFLKNVSDNSHPLDEKVAFANTEVKKSDYISRRLPYSMAAGEHSAWDELIDTLYTAEDRAKIEWAVGSMISGDSKKIQKFIVLYGPPGAGKGTILEILQKLLVGYYTTFEAKALVGNNNSFATEVFKNNPLLAIQHDGDLSKIADNSKLNSIVSHEEMTMNEKYKSPYTSRVNAQLWMGTNKAVSITDAKSGIIRRLIDVKPTGKKLEPDHYFALMARVDFELGAIAHHCLDTYRKMGKNYYNSYRPLDMMLKTDVFFNFIEANYDIFKLQDGTTLRQGWELYKAYALDAELEYKLPMHKFREELKNYFDEFHDRIELEGVTTRSVYRIFTAMPFKAPVEPPTKPPSFSLVLDESVSLIDEMLMDFPAQYANAAGNPKKYWDDADRMIDGELKKPRPDQICSTVLSEINTAELHFVKVPENHIVIDFDVKGPDGKKSLEANLLAASVWPPTYAEVSKSGGGIHLHYIYEGDTSDLAAEYSPGVEIKVYRGGASLRRKLTQCNNIPVATISSGLPFKEKKPMTTATLQSEKGLRDMVLRNLQKEFHSGTKPSIDFIEHILAEAYEKGIPYDLTDLKPKVGAFATQSSNQALACLKAVQRMQFKSADDVQPAQPSIKEDRLVIFDCEVFPNLFVICWKYRGSDQVVKMINPKPAEVEAFYTNFKLVGFNNRDYDNHMLWARMMGYSNEKLYELSQKIIVLKDRNAKFGEAYNLSYADVYDYSVKKQGLKKWMIELRIHHMENDVPWDQPVPPEKVDQIVEYCCNDVEGLEKVMDHLEADFTARKILSDMSGLPVNSPTRNHATRIIFGNERNPQQDFVYTDLSEMFPGYEFDQFAKLDKSTYRGEVVGEGGYVYAEPGIYENVALLDVASMHPTSMIELNIFGPHTEKFQRLLDARLCIKRANEAWKKGDESLAQKFLGEANALLPGVLLTKENAKQLSDALKLVINSIYGYTSAKFDNPFRDKRNIDNIVAKRGALFMIDLKNAIQEQGYTVAHIKTDSVKIPDADQDIIEFVYEFGAKYGYTFEHEATYDKFCLVNDAVYIARQDEKDAPGAYETKWTAVGAQFQHPFVYKTLFSKEPVTFDDMCETKQVAKGAMYLDFQENAATPNQPYAGMHFIGRIGLFVPVIEEVGGATLTVVRDDKPYSVGGTKGYKWVEAEMIKVMRPELLDRMPFERLEDAVQGTGSIADVLDMPYYTQKLEDAVQTIEKFGSFDEFVK
jgi:energy-coupling factor transporter ATP-binding protein EcfA2